MSVTKVFPDSITTIKLVKIFKFCCNFVKLFSFFFEWKSHSHTLTSFIGFIPEYLFFFFSCFCQVHLCSHHFVSNAAFLVSSVVLEITHLSSTFRDHHFIKHCTCNTTKKPKYQKKIPFPSSSWIPNMSSIVNFKILYCVFL